MAAFVAYHPLEKNLKIQGPAHAELFVFADAVIQAVQYAMRCITRRVGLFAPCTTSQREGNLANCAVQAYLNVEGQMWCRCFLFPGRAPEVPSIDTIFKIRVPKARRRNLFAHAPGALSKSHEHESCQRPVLGRGKS